MKSYLCSATSSLPCWYCVTVNDAYEVLSLFCHVISSLLVEVRAMMMTLMKPYLSFHLQVCVIGVGCLLECEVCDVLSVILYNMRCMCVKSVGLM